MKYGEICVFTTTEASEAVAEILSDVTGQAVSVRDKKDLEQGGWDYVEDGLEKTYSDEVEVRGFFVPDEEQYVRQEIAQRLDILRDCFENCGSLRTETTYGDDGEWLVNWQKNFTPVDFGKLVVCPQWLDANTDKPVLRLNSGIAFGTGTHETTAMCLKFLCELGLKDEIVIDVGCGSGILGLAALLLGAKHAVLVDVDAQAVDAAEENARLNGLTDKCRFVLGNLCEKVTEQGIVFANLTADILALLANDITKVVAPRSRVVVSGILKDRLQSTLALFNQKGLVTEKTATEGEWSAAVLYLPTD